MSVAWTGPDGTRTGFGPDDVLHAVGYIQGFLEVLRIKVPRALCGDSLISDEPRLEDPASLPTCPRCVAILGREPSRAEWGT